MKDAMGLQKNSEFVGLFSYHTGRLHELGQIDKILKKYLPDGGADCPSHASAVGLENTALAFLIVGVGLLIACLLVLLEKICKTRMPVAGPGYVGRS